MADALLDDLDDLSDADSEKADQSPSYEDGGAGGGGGYYGTGVDDDDDDDRSGGDDDAPPPSRAGGGRPRLLDEPSLKLHLSSIRAAGESGDDDDGKPAAADATTLATKEDDDAQHALVIASNRHLVSLDHEIHRAHLDLRRLYHPRFPELEDLLPDPFQFRAAVGAIRNDVDSTSRVVAEDKLNGMLTSSQVITMSVAGSTTGGRVLTDDEMKAVDVRCAYLDELRMTRDGLTNFVERRAGRWCPNVSALIGPSLAARMLSCVGGLGELCRVPACNLQLLGRKRGSGNSGGSSGGDGMATRAREQHAGYLMECDLVASLPNYLGMRAAKAVAGKLALAARTDHVNVETGRVRTSDVGRRLRGELAAKFAKWEEPDRAQVVKALPK